MNTWHRKTGRVLGIGSSGKVTDRKGHPASSRMSLPESSTLGRTVPPCRLISRVDQADLITTQSSPSWIGVRPAFLPVREGERIRIYSKCKEHEKSKILPCLCTYYVPTLAPAICENRLGQNFFWPDRRSRPCRLNWNPIPFGERL